MTHAHRSARLWAGLAGLVLGLVLALGAGGSDAFAQTTCPDPTHPTVDYNCPVGPTYLIPGLTDLNGWKDPSQYENILAGDLIEEDGVDELVVRGASGIQVYRFDKTVGQWSQIAVDPILPDTDGWNQPKYYSTIQLGRFLPGEEARLVARSRDGLIVYQFVPGATPDTGTWSQLNTSGPMGDKACFSNGKCWGDDPSYYSTITVGDVGLGPNTVVGRGADGVEAYTWNGAGWDQGPSLAELSDANGWNKPEYYSTIQVGDDAETLFARGPTGLRGYQIAGSPQTWQKLVADGPFADNDCFKNGKCWNSGPQYYSTIQVAPQNHLSGDIRVIGRGADGIETWQSFPAAGGGQGLQWQPIGDRPPTVTTPFSDADGFDKPEYYRTIQLANIRGSNPGEIVVDLLGRGPTGMVMYNLNLNPPGGNPWSAPVAAGEPALADDPWSKCACYYDTIQTASIDGTVGHALIARGAHGIRTWRFDKATSTWTRPISYGNYPVVEPTAFAALNTFLGIASGSIRDVYTDPTRNPTSDQLQSFQNSIAATCTGLLSASPPQYQSCTPPASAPGVSPTVWTSVSNQILKELFWARQVIDHFTTIESMNTQLFLDQDSEFPAIGAELKLGQAPDVVADVDYLGLLEGVFDLLSVIPVGGEVFELTGAALGIAAAATPTGSGSEPSEFDHKFAEMQTHIAQIRQETQDANTAHRHFVLGDYGLLQAVGHLVASQVWRLDTQAALSAGRQGFTHWAYNGLLPALWDEWTVNGCAPLQQDVCTPPQKGKGMDSYVSNSDGSTTFTGLVPRQTPCTAGFTFHCDFASLETGYADALNTLRDPVTTACTYNPQAGTSWEYGTCSLGVSFDELDARNAAGFRLWNFRFFSCTQNGLDNSECVRNQPKSVVGGSATGIGTRFATVQLSIEEPMAGTLDLRRARVTLGRLLHELGGAAEMVNHPSGADLVPRVHTVTRAFGPSSAIFQTPLGTIPRVLGALSVRNGMLRVNIQIGAAALDVPQLCGDDARTHLGTHLIVEDGVNRPVQVVSTAPWQCVSARGVVHSIRLGAVR